MSSCLIQENVSCSSFFDEVEYGVTMAHAVVTAIIMLVSIPLNVTLLTALIVYFEYIEDSFIYVISMFASNILVSIFFGGGVLLSSAMRDWPFGYVGCQVIGFCALAGLSSRWVAMGVFIFDRALRIFRPFWYSRWSKYIPKILVTVPWLLVLIHVPLLANFGGRIDFVDHFPTCLINHHCDDPICFGIQLSWTLWCLFFGGLLPWILLTLMCVKARRMARADLSRLMGRFEVPVMGTFGESPDTPREETTRFQADDTQATNPSQVGDSQGNLAQCADSQANPAECADPEANPAQCADSQANPAQCADRQANPAQCADSQANRSRANRSQANHSRANSSQFDHLQVNRSQANNLQQLSSVERRLITTYFLMMVAFFIPMTFLAIVIICNFALSANHTPTLTIVSFVLTDCFQIYAIFDIIIVWRNKQGKVILRRLYRAIRVFI